MTTIPIIIKHGGKQHPFELDTTKSVPEFREEVYNKTGVAPAQQKILIKGVLKDDASFQKLGLKSGQVVTLIGTAGELPKAPVQQMKFLEDMDDSELAQAMRIPAGLQNLGNTCYMNSTVQVLRQIPELKSALSGYNESISSMNPERRLVAGLRDLYAGLDKAPTDYPPLLFWQMLRTFRPQFDQQDNHGHFAQQDAEECWNSVVAALKDTLGGKFAESYMSGKLLTSTSSPEAPDETPSVREETFYNLTCAISASTNYLVNGLKDGFTQQIEKNSATLGRNAIYNSVSSVSRLPNYLTIHLNRFYWRPDIRKKTKIMRRVKFPFELDATDLSSDELKAKILPLNSRLKEVEKDRAERLKVAKRTKKDKSDAAQGAGASGSAMAVDGAETPAETDEEKSKRKSEEEELTKLIHEEFKNDSGCNASGMYDLIGLVTHKGSSADGGHYIGWAKNTDKEDSWFKFDDAKVTEVNDAAITSLEGGGEGSVAYLLLYAAKKLA